MPVHTITFNLPEEHEELETTLKASKMSSALYDFSMYLRQQYKYSDKWDDLEKIRDKFYEICNEHEVNPNG